MSCGISLEPGLWKWATNFVHQPRGTWLMNSGLWLQLSEFPPGQGQEDFQSHFRAGPGRWG